MVSFYKHELVKTDNGYIVKLYLEPQLTEFANEFNKVNKEDKEGLESSARKYVKERFPNIKVNAVKIMAGTMLVSTLTLGAGMMGNEVHAAENDNVATEEATETNTDFTDLVEGAYYEEAVKALAEDGIINGYTDGTFKPLDSITRGEAAKIIAESLNINLDVVEAPNPEFTDVNNEKYYYKAIAVLADLGVIDGYKDGTFKPDQTITRGELAKMIVEAYDDIDEDETATSAFDDVDSDAWYAPYIAALTSTGITTGTSDDKFSPKLDAKRGETATFVYRVLNPDKRINPVAPVEPGETTEPTDPADPGNATEPTDPADPGNATDPVEPTEPGETTEPVEPTEPGDVAEEVPTSTGSILNDGLGNITFSGAHNEDFEGLISSEIKDDLVSLTINGKEINRGQYYYSDPVRVADGTYTVPLNVKTNFTDDTLYIDVNGNRTLDEGEDIVLETSTEDKSEQWTDAKVDLKSDKVTSVEITASDNPIYISTLTPGTTISLK